MRRIRWGLVGGGEGSQIGPLHRIAAAVDGRFDLVAGALDIDPAKGRAFAASLGIAENRAYGDWRQMLRDERAHADPVELVTVATPNATHYEITRAFLEAGFDVLCEKPMTMEVGEARDIVAVAERTGRICAVNFGYSGYPLVREMRAMIARGDLGAVRLVVAEFAHGFHADAGEADNPRLRWRYDPAEAGRSAVLADAGIHALHMAGFVTGQGPSSVSAHFASTVAGRQLEDDAAVIVRMDGGALCRLWTSAVAVGQMHGLGIRVFGEKGGLRWAQEQPNQLAWTPLGGRTVTIERGDPGLSAAAAAAGRITVGHAEGLPMAFANIYRDLAEAIAGREADTPADPAAALYPTERDGFLTMATIAAAVDSAAHGGRWTDVETV